MTPRNQGDAGFLVVEITNPESAAAAAAAAGIACEGEKAREKSASELGGIYWPNMPPAS
jgi:hypothetical protein